MSLSPIPVHLSCFGVSSDAMNMVRGYSKPSYSDRLASVRNSLAVACPETSSAATSSSALGTSTNGNRAAAHPSSCRQAAADNPRLTPSFSSRFFHRASLATTCAQLYTFGLNHIIFPAPNLQYFSSENSILIPQSQGPQVKLQPVQPDTAQQVLGNGPAATASGRATASDSPSMPNSLIYRATTKHVKTVVPALQCLDFISTAVNSVGGGGVPRPYGKFQACRSGDGNATWERLPPPPGSWQARALPIAVTLLAESPPSSAGGARSSSPQPASSSSRLAPGTAPAAAAAAAGDDGTGRGAGRELTRVRMPLTPPAEGPSGYSSPHSHGHGYSRGRSRSHPSPGGTAPYDLRGHARTEASKPASVTGTSSGSAGLGPRMYEQSYYRRPGSSQHRSLVPLPPPEPHNLSAWFALPAATFLADVPDVPEQLRMDNGYSVSREFLMSGLNPPRRLPPPSPPLSPIHFLGSSSSRPEHPGAPNPASNNTHLFRQQQQQQQAHGGGGAHAALAPQPRAEDSLALWNVLEASAAAAVAAQNSSSSSSNAHGGSPGKLRGVYVPLEKRMQEPLTPGEPLTPSLGPGGSGGGAVVFLPSDTTGLLGLVHRDNSLQIVIDLLLVARLIQALVVFRETSKLRQRRASAVLHSAVLRTTQCRTTQCYLAPTFRQHSSVILFSLAHLMNAWMLGSLGRTFFPSSHKAELTAAS
ncbi:hypothetical protein VOLCADRAFT_106640 [Volvox carteri f. nagariensis]|uniref:Uncharacterized protein n=1 Tax=Volvox carteri f. nagariensis TaxID=3068 RepID=D8U8U2_VOLCA|nr:uncharacterized protein VOLCADRAFT_106640 [Volvox carteri f. nagariensis]EFJ43866.1 hypothetical protein VOLCADRAFT_106640 [Volvox carteri f. nagariensis]|eukprot:XP_002955112.1 hypothetical protein VOLCADRAFT_106640 [Volvox carteri f. nagariensis]